MNFERAWRAMYGPEVINLRIGWTYGLRLPRPRVPKLLVDAVVRGDTLHLAEGGNSRMDHVCVDDIVQGVLAALDHPFDVCNLATDTAPSVHEIIGMLREIVPGAHISAGDGEIKHPGASTCRGKAHSIFRVRRRSSHSVLVMTCGRHSTFTSGKDASRNLRYSSGQRARGLVLADQPVAFVETSGVERSKSFALRGLRAHPGLRGSMSYLVYFGQVLPLAIDP